MSSLLKIPGVSYALSWIRTNGMLLINAGSLLGTTVVTSLLGFVYWWVAARYFVTDVVGIASAAISVMTLLGTFCVMGLGTLLITEIPRSPDKAASLMSTGLSTVAVIGGSVGLLFAIIAPLLSHQFSLLDQNPLTVCIFALGVSLTSVTLVLDQALIALLCGRTQLVRNSLFSVIKLVALLLVGFFLTHATGMAIYTTWMMGNLLSLFFIALPLLFARQRRPLRHYLPRRDIIRQLGSTALQHHLLNITLQFPAYALPTIVTVLLSARMNALFYVSWMIVNFVFYIPAALTVVLHAMNSAQQSMIATRARTTIGLALAVCVLACIGLQLMTGPILSVFGPSYKHADWTLRVLILAAFPIIIKNHYISICRIQDRVRQAMWIIGPGCLLEIGFAVFGSHLDGLIGLSMGWVIAIYLEALLMAPTIYRALWPDHGMPLADPAQFLTPVDAFLSLEHPAPASPLPMTGKVLLGTPRQHSDRHHHSLRPLRLQRIDIPSDGLRCIGEKEHQTPSSARSTERISGQTTRSPAAYGSRQLE